MCRMGSPSLYTPLSPDLSSSRVSIVIFSYLSGELVVLYLVDGAVYVVLLVLREDKLRPDWPTFESRLLWCLAIISWATCPYPTHCFIFRLSKHSTLCFEEKATKLRRLS